MDLQLLSPTNGSLLSKMNTDGPIMLIVVYQWIYRTRANRGPVGGADRSIPRVLWQRWARQVSGGGGTWPLCQPWPRLESAGAREDLQWRVLRGEDGQVRGVEGLQVRDVQHAGGVEDGRTVWPWVQRVPSARLHQVGLLWDLQIESSSPDVAGPHHYINNDMLLLPSTWSSRTIMCKIGGFIVLSEIQFRFLFKCKWNDLLRNRNIQKPIMSLPS